MEPKALVQRFDRDAAFNFFLSELSDRARLRRLPETETTYVAGVLTKDVESSRCHSQTLPPFGDLTEVFDRFLYKEEFAPRPDVLMTAGEQILVLAGYFGDQMKRRHNVLWFERRGQHFYGQASRLSAQKGRQEFLLGMARNFPTWTMTLLDLQRNFLERRHLPRYD